jgi:hypothetical protein
VSTSDDLIRSYDHPTAGAAHPAVFVYFIAGATLRFYFPQDGTYTGK